MSCAFPTRHPLHLVTVLLKRFQPSKPGKREEQIRHPVARQPGHPAEDEGENARGHERLQEHPNDPEGRLLVTQLQIARRQREEEIAKAPDLSGLQRRAAGAAPYFDERLRGRQRERGSHSR